MIFSLWILSSALQLVASVDRTSACFNGEQYLLVVGRNGQGVTVVDFNEALNLCSSRQGTLARISNPEEFESMDDRWVALQFPYVFVWNSLMSRAHKKRVK